MIEAALKLLNKLLGFVPSDEKIQAREALEANERADQVDDSSASDARERLHGGSF